MTTITTADLTGLLNDINTIDDVVESNNLTTISKDGKTIRTLAGEAAAADTVIADISNRGDNAILDIETRGDAAIVDIETRGDNAIDDIETRGDAALGALGGVHIGDYSTDPLITARNQYVTFGASPNATQWKITDSTSLNYQIDSTTYTDPEDDPALINFNDVTRSYLHNTTVSYFETLTDALNSTSIAKMKVVDIKNRTDGNNDGGSVWDVVLTSSVTVTTWDIVTSAFDPTYSIVLRAFNGALNVKAAGAIGKIVNSDSPAFQACATRAGKQGLDIFEPPVLHDEGYYLEDPVVIENVVAGLANAIKVFGGGNINSAGTCARILYPVDGIAFDSRQIGGRFDNMTFEQFVGTPGGTVTATNTVGPLSITVDHDPWALTGGVPILWTNTVTLTDLSTRTDFFQFAVFGAWTATGVTDNGNGTWTLEDVKGINGTLDSALGAIQVGKTIEGFSSYAHFEDITPGSPAAIFLDTAENGYYTNLWFTQVKRCFSHDLGSGAGIDSNKGNLGLFSNIIVDGANDFIANTDISGPSQQSLHGGQFINLQLFSTRNAFNGRRLQNLQFATLTFNFSDTLFRASELQGCTVGAGSIIGWETGTGFINDVINITGICADLTINGSKFGRHSVAGGPVITVGEMINLSLTGSSLESVSEGGGGTAAWLHTENTLIDSTIGQNSIGRIGAGEENLTWSQGASFTSASDMDETEFNQTVKTFTLPDNLVHHQASSGAFGYMDSRLTFKSGGAGTTAIDINTTWVYVDNKSYYRFDGTLTANKAVALPSFGDRPFDPDQFTFDIRAANLNGFNFVINSPITGTIIIATKAGTYTVKKVAGEWIPFNYIPVQTGGVIL